jgi:ankyrin repeat protein
MRRIMIRAACGVSLSLLLVAACDAQPPKPPSSEARAPSPTINRPAARNLLMGTGEPRRPQPFTIEQRLLDAVSRGDRVTVERALQHGATVGAKDDLGRSTVILAVMDAGNLDLVRWLHAKGAALDEPDVGGRAALSFAAAKGHLSTARYLVENGAVLDRPDAQRRTPLFHAALGNHRDVVGFLLDHGADVNTRDRFGDTPLIAACAKGHPEMATFLMQRGADPDLKDQEGRTARQRAAAGTGACLTPAPKLQ